MARLAIILHRGSPGPKELRLSHILDFFGVPWTAVDASHFADLDRSPLEYAVFGSVQAIAVALKQRQRPSSPLLRPGVFYAYADDERGPCERALQFLLGNANLSLHEVPPGNLSLNVSSELADIVGPMAGLEVSVRGRNGDAVLIGAGAEGKSMFSPIISAAGAPIFLQSQHDNSSIFLCTSSQMVDIDQPVGQGFYDVKEHFCSVVPLVMFIRLIFPDVAWRPQELGACLIIDDPLLRSRYGFCDFAKLRDLMRRHEFTTNIAFIPWNWRRTSRAAGDFFREESELFSVSIHGCDHTASEFGTTSLEVLHARAQLAQFRMRNHESRTGVHHDEIMIFPQGVFSSACPEVLKRDGFLAAVNTEVVPADFGNARTRIRDVWDVAVMSYGDFPTFSRRYAFHGLENFAFDFLLGKPCLIVAHHGFFKDGGTGLIELIEKLHSLNCSLQWRSLGEVIRRACRRRVTNAGGAEVEMYGAELLIDNPSDRVLEVKIHKREAHADLISEVLCDRKPVTWETEGDCIAFEERILPRSQGRVQVFYREQADSPKLRRSLRYEISVALRRILSEMRDGYLSKSRLLAPLSRC